METRRGRPRKFAAPSRAVTVTLPEHVIDALTAIEPDLSRAIVRLAPALTEAASGPAALTHFGRHAVIVVSPTRTLEKRAGVELVPLPDGRALISFPRATTMAELELNLEDALDDPGLARGDRTTFESVLAIIRDARRSDDVSLLQRSIIVLEKRPTRLRGALAQGRPASRKKR